MSTIPFTQMGGKARLAEWIEERMPEHRVYIEPFCGSASVLLSKNPSRIEIINDLDGGIVNFFRVLRNENKAKKLAQLVELTPFARREYDIALESPEGLSDIEQARRFLVGNRMRYGSTSGSFITSIDENYSSVWSGIPSRIMATAKRLKHCIIECRDARELIEQYDKQGVFFYIDPPYLQSTRTSTNRYTHEYSEEDHLCLIAQLNNLRYAKYALSGYENSLYDENLIYEERHTTEARTQINTKRTEILWTNYHTQLILPLDL